MGFFSKSSMTRINEELRKSDLRQPAPGDRRNREPTLLNAASGEVSPTTILTARVGTKGHRSPQTSEPRRDGWSTSAGKTGLQPSHTGRNLRPGAKTPIVLAQSTPTQIDPWPASPLTRNFRDEIHKRESGGRNYREEKAGIAWGRYQMTRPALRDVGMMDANGNWTGKHGIHNKGEFLKNPEVQEKAMAEYMRRNLAQLQANGALQDVGQQINGLKGKITITTSSLLAAAHRQGAGMVKQYLEHQRRHNWTTDPKTLPKARKDAFLSVETRLREFQHVPAFRRRK